MSIDRYMLELHSVWCTSKTLNTMLVNAGKTLEHGTCYGNVAVLLGLGSSVDALHILGYYRYQSNVVL